MSGDSFGIQDDIKMYSQLRENDDSRRVDLSGESELAGEGRGDLGVSTDRSWKRRGII